MLYPTVVYKKANRVIESCTNEVHLQAARRYVNLFFEYYSTPTPRFKYSFKEVLTDDLISRMYSKLLKKLHQKQLEISN